MAGKVTGAVFAGDGNFVLDPPASERSMLKLLTKEDEFSENFSQMVLRFTDSTYDDIKRGGSVVTSGCDAGPLKDSQHTTRHKLKTISSLASWKTCSVRSLEACSSPSSTASITTARNSTRSIRMRDAIRSIS